MVQCCFGCPYRGSELGVRRHIAARHGFMMARERGGPGRPRKGQCALCGGFHRTDVGPGVGHAGRIAETRRDVHTTEVHATGRFQHGERMALPTVTVPEEATHLNYIRFYKEGCRGPFRGKPDPDRKYYCTSCKYRHARGIDIYGKWDLEFPQDEGLLLPGEMAWVLVGSRLIVFRGRIPPFNPKPWAIPSGGGAIGA
jgi:hypothetical protein